MNNDISILLIDGVPFVYCSRCGRVLAQLWLIGDEIDYVAAMY